MKRKELIRYLSKNGCIFVREGVRHSVFFNPLTKKVSTVPRHSEINNLLAEKICRDLDIESLRKEK